MHEYAAITAALHEATGALLLKRGADLQNALTATKAARSKCAEARLALSDHKAVCTTCKSAGASKQGNRDPKIRSEG